MSTVNIKINGYDYTMKKGITILDASFETMKFKREFMNQPVPTLYYLKGVNDIDESGVCVVEVDGQVVNASTTRIKEGMEIQTKTPAVMAARKAALTAILETHNKDCLNCFRSETCELQTLLHEYGFSDEVENKAKPELLELDTTSVVLVRDNSKCIKCKRCINACAKLQAVSAIVATGKGLDTVVQPSSPAGLAAASCVNCGQCVAVCPVGALYEKDSTAAVKEALADEEKYVVVQVAPAVRAALGETFEFPVGVDVEGRIAAACRKLGFDKVFDTSFAADLTIMEEVNELVGRIENDGVLPMITSCCPGWIKYAEHFYPDMLDNISTCKSPQQMFGSVAKSYLAEKLGIAKENMVVVSVMPCTAKKFELTREELQDVDISITTNELGKMLKEAEIQLAALPNEKFDDFMGEGTGAAVIFGATGGVMEAALRVAGKEVKGIAVSGLAKANELLSKVKAGEVEYDFIEIMACPGGCVNGGGQPYQPASVQVLTDVIGDRAAALRKNDEEKDVRRSDENASVKALYAEYLGAPGSEKAHELLHTSYSPR